MIVNAPASTTTPTNAPTRIHPALHFDPKHELATVGIVNAAGKPVLIMRRTGHLPVMHAIKNRSGGLYSVDQYVLSAAPTQLGFLAGRWGLADVIAFTKDGVAPTFADFLNQVRTELRRQIEFARPEAA